MSCLVVHFSEIYTDRLKMQRNNTVSYQYILLTLKLCSLFVNTFCIHIYILQVHYSVNTKQKYAFAKQQNNVCFLTGLLDCTLAWIFNTTVKKFVVFFQLVSKLFCRRFLCRDWSGDLINIIWFCLEHLSLFIFHVTFNQGQLKALTWSWKTEQFCYRKYFCAFTFISLAIKDESPSQKAKKKNVYIGL